MPSSRRSLATIAAVIAVAIVSAHTAYAQSPPSVPKCSSDSALRALDFWIGDWNVVDSTGTTMGTNRIEKILDGCAVTELWREDGLEGRSLFYYVPAQRTWKQVWVTPNALAPGGLKEKHLVAQGAGRVRFQGEIVGSRGNLIFDRTTLTTIGDGRLRQVIEISRDGGTTWEKTFDGIYLRVNRP